MFDLNWDIVIIRDKIGTLKAPTDDRLYVYITDEVLYSIDVSSLVGSLHYWEKLHGSYHISIRFELLVADLLWMVICLCVYHLLQ